MSPTSILDLPSDIPCLIFDEFRDKTLVIYGRVNWPSLNPDRQIDDRYGQLRNIHSARLVCRLFNQVALPLLCPILRICLSQASINRSGAHQ